MRVRSLARHGLAAAQNKLDDFFAASHIDLWQYPVAETLCQFMIRSNRKAYVEFIDGIKEGKPWQQSLEAGYKMPLDKLVGAYLESLKARRTVRGLWRRS